MSETPGMLIQRKMREHSVNGVMLAKLSGMETSYISELRNDEKKVVPPPHVVEALEKYLGISPAEYLRAWGYPVEVGPQPEDPRVAEFIEMLPYLSDAALESIRMHAEYGRTNSRKVSTG